MKGSLLAVACFILGLIIANAGLAPQFLRDNDFSTQVLWLMIFMVGITVGGSPSARELIRQIRPQILLLPLATIVGTYAGVALLSVFLVYRLAECCAIGAGFAYYSLSSIIISQYNGPELGTIALLSNLLRELISLLIIPVLARLWSPAAGIVSAGVTSLDSCLPCIIASSGEKWLLPALVHGMVMEISVPFWVLLFCTL